MENGERIRQINSIKAEIENENKGDNDKKSDQDKDKKKKDEDKKSDNNDQEDDEDDEEDEEDQEDGINMLKLIQEEKERNDQTPSESNEAQNDEDKERPNKINNTTHWITEEESKASREALLKSTIGGGVEFNPIEITNQQRLAQYNNIKMYMKANADLLKKDSEFTNAELEEN